MKFRRLKALYHQIFIQMRRLRLKNHNFSIISNNCCGGIIYHDLMKKYDILHTRMEYILVGK